MSPRSPHSAAPRRSVAPLAAIAGVGAALSALVFWAAAHWESGKARAYFERLAAERVGELRETLEVEQFALVATRAFYDGSERVERHEFRSFAAICLSHLGATQALEWVPLVPGPTRAECERAARAEGVDGYEIRETDGEGGLVRAPARAECFPVLFVEPRAGNERALGFNMASDPARWEAMARARDSGAVVVTGRIAPVREAADKFELLLLVAVYRRGQPIATVAERRANLDGFIVGVLRPQEFLASTMSRLSVGGVDKRLYDLSAPEGERFLAYHPSRLREGTPPPPEALDAKGASVFRAESKLRVGKRLWSVVCTASPQFVSGARTWLPWAGLACGLALTGALAFYLVLRHRHQERLNRAAAQVARANETLETEAIARRQANARLEEEAAGHARAARNVHALQRQIEFVLGATKTGLDIIDAQFNLRYVDPAWAKSYGDWAGRKCHEYFMGLCEPCPGCGIPEALRTRRIVVTEETLPRENNRRVQVTTIPFQDDGGEWLVAEVNADITELARRAEELAAARKALLNMVDDLERSRRAAEAANRAKSEFLANMSHEIRTPMNAILGFAKLLLREPLTADQRECVETICRSGNDLLALINDILDLSRIEADRMQLSPEVVDVASVARSVCELLELRAAEKGIRLAVEADPRTPAAATTDHSRLRQILLNLVGNALKFTDTGSVTVTVGPAEPSTGGTGILPVSHRLEACATHIHFVVADTGLGIPLERQGAIFDAFVQADGSATRRFGGTGLGLTISRRLATLLGGRIWVESTPGKGSAFHFTIRTHLAAPRDGARDKDQATSDELPGASGKPAGPATPASPPSALVTSRQAAATILVADDNPVGRDYARRVLEREGYRVAEAADGQEALAAARDQAVGLVLMDVGMPGMDGLEATRRLRGTSHGAHLPIIALTAHAMAGDEERCRQAGCDAYLAKPVDPDDLLRTVARHLPPEAVPTRDSEPETRNVETTCAQS